MGRHSLHRLVCLEPTLKTEPDPKATNWPSVTVEAGVSTLSRWLKVGLILSDQSTPYPTLTAKPPPPPPPSPPAPPPPPLLPLQQRCPQRRTIKDSVSLMTAPGAVPLASTHTRRWRDGSAEAIDPLVPPATTEADHPLSRWPSWNCLSMTQTQTRLKFNDDNNGHSMAHDTQPNLGHSAPYKKMQKMYKHIQWREKSF